MTFDPPESRLISEAIPEVADLELLEKGGFKAVYRARIGQGTEAFKLVELPAVETSQEAEAFRLEMSARVRREIEALGKCKSPQIVKLGRLAATDLHISGRDYVAYSEEFLAGKNLWMILNSIQQKPSEEELRTLFVSLLTSIRELWSHGYVHRDIKPHNVMRLAEPGRPFVLLDLGIAYSVREASLTFNPSQRVLATYRYLAPEMAQVGFREHIDFRSDLYTTALTVFEYAAQQHPLAHTKDDLIQTVSRAIHQAPIPLRQLRADLSAEFCQVIDQMLKKKPALRPGNLAWLINTFQPTV
jgi:serine/threonine protein kinase